MDAIASFGMIVLILSSSDLFLIDNGPRCILQSIFVHFISDKSLFYLK